MVTLSVRVNGSVVFQDKWVFNASRSIADHRKKCLGHPCKHVDTVRDMCKNVQGADSCVCVNANESICMEKAMLRAPIFTEVTLSPNST